MPPQVAQLFCIAYVAWLFAMDRSRRPGVSSAMWIPFLWLLIISSRPLSAWLGLGGGISEFDENSEGSPMDRMVFLLLMGAGAMVLLQRGIDVASVISQNRPLFFFYGFWLVSTIWSDYSFISFKRWVKDFGHVIMILVIMSEKDPVQAVRWLFARLCYVLIPLSVLFIKYFPHIGRMYNRWSWEFSYVGVTTNKNALGPLVFICWLFLLWEMFRMPLMEANEKFKWKYGVYGILGLMCVWLLRKANSQTAWVCFLLATTMSFIMKRDPQTGNVRVIEALGVMGLLFLLVLDPLFGITDWALGLMGRNRSLTGRTGIWELVLEAGTNPWIGTGFYSFWMTEPAQKITEIYEGINQAHNGYLETYLNGGFLGVGCLLLVLCSGYQRTRAAIAGGSDLERIRFIILICLALYSLTEAFFSRMGLLWFCVLLTIVRWSRSPERKAAYGEIKVEQIPDEMEQDCAPGRGLRA